MVWLEKGLCVNTGGHQLYPTLATDGQGGAIVAWADFDRQGTEETDYIRIQQIDSNRHCQCLTLRLISWGGNNLANSTILSIPLN